VLAVSFTEADPATALAVMIATRCAGIRSVEVS
jgi:hypothetical protein